ncbi:hypothetical protein SULYE_0194 [Sulfurihydrogenibium yellowstonense SS-5]|uniref:Uncharacterized protein n=1 Tax=Sulfurihydrogenibium yellowstonense SS-5 TaxID=432331 RepID=C4FI10_9AQUI|nr:hypothetical protein SULYE_0194 [Sulfurihydrogenibium yellowstonense SS-5]
MIELYNPHGSDVTKCSGNKWQEKLELYNPHGSDVTLKKIF